MPIALFIHGLHSDEHSSTGQVVRSLLNKHRIELIAPSFDVLNPEKTVQEINTLIRDNSISLIIGHSLGGFYTLAALNGPMKMYINPCLLPAEILPALEPGIEPETLACFRRLTDHAFDTLDREARITAYGIFAKDDTLFSFYDLFKQHFGARCRYINGGHKPSKEDIAETFDSALQLIHTDINRF